MTVKDICTIVLKYDEPGWTQATLDCCDRAGITKIVMADRDGVGNMSKAFNRALPSALASEHKYIWFLTNVTFRPDAPNQLVQSFEDSCAAVHPAHASDHIHLILCGDAPKNVPFIEFTAPMFCAKALSVVGPADEDMPYWGMDLDWSYRARAAGYNLRVCGARVEHVYLRHMRNPHPISKIRAQLRKVWDAATVNRLREKYGNDWQQKLWPR